MVKIISDKYVLGESKSKSITGTQKEAKLDIRLKMNYKEITGAIVEGIVTDYAQNPLEGALVQLIANDYKLVMNTTTDVDGSYNLNNIPLKNDSILYAFYPGKKIPTGVIFTPGPFQTTNINFALEVDNSLKLAIIAGIVMDFTTQESIRDAILYLYKITDANQIEDSSNETLTAVIRSNYEGYFVFSELEIGNYSVKVTKLGYKFEKTLVAITQQPQIVNLELMINVNENIEQEILGEISGIAEDERGIPISNLDVVLYSINFDGSEIPIAYTQTNNEGLYVFKGILPGKYKVKSNKLKVVSIGTDNIDSTIISPNFNGFIIANSSSYIKTEHDVATDEIELLNNAVKYIGASYTGIINLGGPNNGTVNLFVTVHTEGIYIMCIEYLAQQTNQSFSLTVNNEVYNSLFLIETTNSSEVGNPKTTNILMLLNSGENVITFANNLDLNAPILLSTTYQLCGTRDTINATKGRLFGATIGLEETFVIGIGGPYIGSSDFSKRAYFELDFYVIVASEYTLFIQYISGDTDRPLKIDVNGVNSGGVYMLNKTDGWFANDAEIFEIPVNLRAGKNTIKFYSKKDYVGPNIGDVTCRSNFPTYELDITQATLIGGATLVNQTMVKNLGGSLNGAVIFTISPLFSGIYSMIFSCINSGDGITYLKVDVNGVNSLNFIMPSTGGNILKNVMQVTLDQGQNIIKFYNDNGNHAPYIGDVKIILIGSGEINTNAVNGELNQGATLSFNGNMVNIGGGQNSVFLLLTIPVYGKYKSTINFIVGDEDGAALSIYINDKLYNVISLPSTNTDSINDANQFIIRSNFTGKQDSIMFFNNNSEASNLNVGKIVIKKELVVINEYNLEDVELLNGAALVNGMIINVAKYLGMIRLSVNAPRSGSYDLIISYVAESNNTTSQVSINSVLADIDVTFEETNSMNIEDSKQQVVTLNLIQGLNVIQIYNS